MSITSPHVKLKNPSFDDYEHFYKKRFQPEVVFWADDCFHNVTLDEYALNRLMAISNREIIERIITINNEPIGTVTAREFVQSKGICTLGIVIADKHYWGKGIGTEALKLFLTLLSLEGQKIVMLDTYANNERALKCFHKLGFKKRRVYYAPQAERFVVQMVKELSPPQAIGTTIKPGDPRWAAPKKA